MINQQNLVSFSLAGGVTLALLVGMSAAANAQDATIFGERPDDQAMTERVSYLDLDLTSEAGEATLVGRVRGAVRRVCIDQPSSRPYFACRRVAWQGAKPQIDLAVARSQEMALNGRSEIPMAAIVIAVPQR